MLPLQCANFLKITPSNIFNSNIPPYNNNNNGNKRDNMILKTKQSKHAVG